MTAKAIESGKGRKDRFAALPPSLRPVGISREAAAAFIGVSTSKFDQMVSDGRMPPAKRIDGRRVWNVRQIEEAFEALPDEEAANPWDAMG